MTQNNHLILDFKSDGDFFDFPTKLLIVNVENEYEITEVLNVVKNLAEKSLNTEILKEKDGVLKKSKVDYLNDIINDISFEVGSIEQTYNKYNLSDKDFYTPSYLIQRTRGNWDFSVTLSSNLIDNLESLKEILNED